MKRSLVHVRCLRYLFKSSIYLTLVDYQHHDRLAAFEEYSSRETPRAFLWMLETRASTNRLTEDIRNDLVDIVQECRIYVYRQYLQEARQNLPAALNINAAPSSAPRNYLLMIAEMTTPILKSFRNLKLILTILSIIA